jgi:hypothetical protein
MEVCGIALSLLLDRAASWAYPEQAEMTVGKVVSAASLQIAVEMIYEVVFDLDARAAPAADQVMVLVCGDLVHEVPLRVQCWLDESIAGEELEGAIDRRLR